MVFVFSHFFQLWIYYDMREKEHTSEEGLGNSDKVGLTNSCEITCLGTLSKWEATAVPRSAMWKSARNASRGAS